MNDGVGKLDLHKAYKFSGIMTIREAKSGNLYLSIAKTNCNIVEIYGTQYLVQRMKFSIISNSVSLSITNIFTILINNNI